MTTGARANQPRALVVRRHHLLVRLSHWLCAYSFMLNGLVYLAGLCLGGGWRSLLPRLSDARGVLQMTRYYLSLPYVILARRQPIQPIEVEPSTLRRWSRRDLLLFGAGALAPLAVGGSQLPRNV